MGSTSLGALETIHRNELLHRDIAPDNIYIRDDGSPVLIDFGSAREAIAQRTKTFSAIVKTGYSPAEQYSTRGSGQGPWSDIYAFAATLYQAVTGEHPEEATERMLADNYVSARQAAKGDYRTAFLDAIDWGLKLLPKERPQSSAEWQPALMAQGVVEAADNQPSIGVRGTDMKLCVEFPGPFSRFNSANYKCHRNERLESFRKIEVGAFSKKFTWNLNRN